MPSANVFSWAVSLLQAPLLAAWLLLTGYLVFLTLSALAARLRELTPSGRKAPPSRAAATHFAVLVPAHDEEVVIGECVDSLMALEYPADRRRIIVIADNCTDSTASIAASRGATVYERTDAANRGKGYALDWAIKRLLAEDGGWTGAVVVFDADTLVDPQFLLRMDERLQKGSLALQGQYNLLNPFDNWRTALLYSALLLHNRLRPLARQALGLTILLKGNGMCFARGVVERTGWNAYGLAEDIEYTTNLLDAGIKVEYVPEATLCAQAPRTNGPASSQRMRWEAGRFSVARREGLRLLLGALRHRSVAELDWAMDILIPPLGILVAVPLLMLAPTALLALLLGGPAILLAWGWLASLVGTGIYVLGGLLICGADRRAYLYLLSTPIFLLWKLRLYAAMLLGRGPKGWVRTERI